MRILCLDSGSSSLKFAVFDVEESAEREVTRSQFGADAPFERVLDELRDKRADDVEAVGHRLVFGGPDHTGPILLTDAVLRDLEAMIAVDPLHIAPELQIVRAARKRLAHAAHVGCFDTAFHQRMPVIAKRLPLPHSFGPLVRRYGYHGLSFEYVVWALGEDARGRVLIAHLGSGASLAAVRNGEPVDTTMGFTPLGGLMMGTRPGDLDPGVLLYALEQGMSAKELADILRHRSGLLGVSETSADMDALERAAETDRRAREAIDLFVYQACKHAAALLAPLGGLDLLVFTGGIGENSPQIRIRIADGLAHLGTFDVRVVPTDENRMIARHVFALASRGG